MTCKQHPAEKGSKGVCAFCLSDRLSALRLASGEFEDSPESEPAPPSCPPALAATTLSPSVSIAHPPSAADRWGNPSLSAPQAGPADSQQKAKQHQKRGRLSSFWRLLRRSGSTGKDSPPHRPRASASKALRISSSWICAFRRKKKSRLFSVDDEIPAIRSRKAEKTTIDRGLSPRSSPEASPDSQKEGSKTPAAKKARRRQLSKLSVCMSPLVRGRPRKSHLHDRFFACKLRGGDWPGKSTEPTLGPNRSKKIADFGKKQ